MLAVGELPEISPRRQCRFTDDEKKGFRRAIRRGMLATIDAMPLPSPSSVFREQEKLYINSLTSLHHSGLPTNTRSCPNLPILRRGPQNHVGRSPSPKKQSHRVSPSNHASTLVQAALVGLEFAKSRVHIERCRMQTQRHNVQNENATPAGDVHGRATRQKPVSSQCVKPLPCEKPVSLILEALYPPTKMQDAANHQHNAKTSAHHTSAKHLRNYNDMTADVDGYDDSSSSDASNNSTLVRPRPRRRDSASGRPHVRRRNSAVERPLAQRRDGASEPARTQCRDSAVCRAFIVKQTASGGNANDQARCNGVGTVADEGKHGGEHKISRKALSVSLDPLEIEARPNAATIAKMESIMALQRQKKERLRQFYFKCMRRFGSIARALECLQSTNIGDGFIYNENTKISGKEWNSLLAKANLCSYRDARELFDLMNDDKDEALSIEELHRGLESVATIKRVEDLRRRILIHHSTTMHAMRAMEPNPSLWDKRLTEVELSHALSKVDVTEEKECRLLFHAIDVLRLGNVSINEVFSSLTGVSPLLLLEDVCDRLTSRFGTIESAWNVLGTTSDVIAEAQFRHRAQAIGLNAIEAAKAFRLIARDSTESMTKAEFIGTIEMSKATLSLEHFRQMLRYNIGSMKQCVHHLYSEELADFAVDSTISRDELQEILEPIGFTNLEFHRYYKLLAFEGRGELSMAEFERRMQLLVPSRVLEDLGSHLLSGDYLSKAQYMAKSQLYESMNYQQFVEKYQSQCNQQVVSERALRTSFDIIDANHDGLITWNEIICGISASMTAKRVQLRSAQREHRVKKQLKRDMEPIYKMCRELKTQVRVGLDEVALALIQTQNASSKIASSCPSRELLMTPLERVCTSLAEQSSPSMKPVLNYSHQITKLLDTHDELLATDYRYHQL